MTWTQVRSLTRHAKELLIELGKPPTPACYFLAFLSLLSATPLPTEGVSYWAYVPDPPIIQPVGWMDPQHIKVLTNDSLRIGGAQNSELRPSTSSFINFEGRADSLPVCLTLQGKAPHGCFTTRYRTFLTDSPDRAQLGDSSGRRWIWEVQMQTLGDPLYKEVFVNRQTSPEVQCIEKYRDKDKFWDAALTNNPTWLQCAFPHAATWYAPVNLTDENLLVWDYSNSNNGSNKIYENYITQNKEKFHNYTYDGLGEPLRSWFSPGIVEPTWFIEQGNITRRQSDLFRLVAAANMFLEKKPGEKKSLAYGLRACLSYPYAMLLAQQASVNISQEPGNSYSVTCHSCKLTNCISSAESKDLDTVIIVRRPSYVLLPVELGEEPWYDNAALQVLEDFNALIRPKRFVAALVLGIAALISILTTFTVATTALVETIQTAQFVNNLNRNVSLALIQQELIDKKLESKLNALEEVVVALGQEMSNLKNTLSVRCHGNFKSICVTPLPYNTSEPWEKVKAHLQGVWTSSSISHDIDSLQKDISVMSQSHLQLGGFNN